MKRRSWSAKWTVCWGDPGEPGHPSVKFAFTNYGVSLGLQAVDAGAERVRNLNAFFDTHRSNDEYDTNAITYVMACTSHLPGKFLTAWSPPRV